MVSSVVSPFASIFIIFGALIPSCFEIAGSISGKTAMAMATEEVDTRALLPMGSVFGNFIQCGGSRNRRTVGSAESVGVVYGTAGDNLPDVRDVVQLYKSNGIRKMRIYGPDEALLNALRGSDIEISLDVPNTDFERLANLSSATGWVQTYIQAYVPSVKFRYITVGNGWQSITAGAQYVLPAMQTISRALAAANLQDQIKVSTAIDPSVLAGSFPPSAGSFTSNATAFLTPIVAFLLENGSPLLANVYPYFAYVNNPQSITLTCALFLSPAIIVTDGSFEYRNLFEAMVDTLYSALEKSGGANVTIVVSESGWPSNGNTAATVGNAGTYYRNLISYVQSGRGTPRRPGRALETYLFAMFDGNEKFSDMSHFGLFTPDKQPKYQLSFS